MCILTIDFYLLTFYRVDKKNRRILMLLSVRAALCLGFLCFTSWCDQWCVWYDACCVSRVSSNWRKNKGSNLFRHKGFHKDSALSRTLLLWEGTVCNDSADNRNHSWCFSNNLFQIEFFFLFLIFGIICQYFLYLCQQPRFHVNEIFGSALNETLILIWVLSSFPRDLVKALLSHNRATVVAAELQVSDLCSVISKNDSQEPQQNFDAFSDYQPNYK